MYVGIEGGKQQLYVRRMEDKDPTALVGTEGAFGPFISPDGEWVGFFSAHHMRKVRLSGGPVISICETPNTSSGATWGEDGTIVFSPDRMSPLLSVSAAGGEVSPLTRLDTSRGEVGHQRPQAINGGVLYSAESANAEWSLRFYDTATNQASTVVDSRARMGRQLASGHLIYGDSAGTIYVTRWDRGQSTPAPPGVPVLEDVRRIESVVGSVSIAQRKEPSSTRGVGGLVPSSFGWTVMEGSSGSREARKALE